MKRNYCWISWYLSTEAEKAQKSASNLNQTVGSCNLSIFEILLRRILLTASAQNSPLRAQTLLRSCCYARKISKITLNVYRSQLFDFILFFSLLFPKAQITTCPLIYPAPSGYIPGIWNPSAHKGVWRWHYFLWLRFWSACIPDNGPQSSDRLLCRTLFPGIPV